MFYQSDYITKRIKEDEIAERIRQAEIDRLEVELQPRSPSLLGQGVHLIGHLVSRIGNWLEKSTWSEANGHTTGHRFAHR